jgi:hypothetical protein
MRGGVQTHPPRPIAAYGHGNIVGMTSDHSQSHETAWRRTGIVVLIVAGFLLLSMGGAIIAAPLTVPLMFIAVRRHPTRVFRITGTLIAGLTVTEVAWAAAYVTAGEAKPWIWLIPCVAAVGALVAFVTAARPAGSANYVSA